MDGSARQISYMTTDNPPCKQAYLHPERETAMLMTEPSNRDTAPHDPHLAAEYDAGYNARCGGLPYSLAATSNWREGWQEGNREQALASRG